MIFKKKKKRFVSTDYKIYWNILYDKYVEEGMQKVSDPILQAIPLINGIPHPGVSQKYGDGNEKIDLKICNIHPILYKLFGFDACDNISKLEESQRETFQCINMPYQGNKNVMSSKLCAYHFMMVWILTGLLINDVNKFIDFFHLRLLINKIHKKKNHAKQLSKYEEHKLLAWNEYNKVKKKQFQNIIANLIYFHKLQKYRKITKIIKFRQPDVVTLNQSFDDNTDNIEEDLKFVHLNNQCMFSIFFFCF